MTSFVNRERKLADPGPGPAARAARSVVILRDIQDLSYEIAAITDTSVGTVKSRLSRGREQLRHILSSIDPDHE
jgi:DNA-directed RNA polymerase specialized sigma24 family protein